MTLVRSKILLLFVALLALGITATSQQLTRSSSFVVNPYLVNPAKVGTEYEVPILANYRTQWAGFEGAPKTYSLSAHAGLPGRFGLGVIAYKDDAGGAISRTGVDLSGAYKVDINRRNQFSFGLSLKFNQFAIDNSILEVRDQNDQSLNGFQAETTFNFDAAFGVMMYGQDYYFGLAAYNIVQSDLNVELNDLVSDFNENRRHYNLSGGYDYRVNSLLMFSGAGLLRFTDVTPVQVDINARAWYKEWFYAGIGYRFGDAITAMVGSEYKNVVVNYSHDLTTGGANAFSPFTHEFTLGYRIQRPDNNFKNKSFKTVKARRR